MDHRLWFSMLRGPETFFSLSVPPDFYTGAGHRLLRPYYLGPPVPYLLETIILARFRLGGLVYYDPDSHSVLMPSRAGYALNFADRRSYITLAYLGGLAFLALIRLRFGRG